MELEVKKGNNNYRKIITLFRKIFLYKNEGRRGRKALIVLGFVWSFMDGWRVFGKLEKKDVCLWGGWGYDWHSLFGWGLEGSQQWNVEGLVGRRVVPHKLLRSLLVEEELHRGQRNDDRFWLDTQEYVSQLHLFRYACPGT